MQLSEKGHNNAKPTWLKTATQLPTNKCCSLPMEGEVGHKRCLSQTERLQLHIAVLLMAILLIYLHFED